VHTTGPGKPFSGGYSSPQNGHSSSSRARGQPAPCWDRIRQLGLGPLAGVARRDGDLPQLARELLDELEERRRLILTSRTFAPDRRTHDSLAAELGVGRERVRQLQTSALQQPGPGSRPRSVPPAALARRIGRTTWRRLRRRDPRRSVVDGPDAVLAGRKPA